VNPARRFARILRALWIVAVWITLAVGAGIAAAVVVPAAAGMQPLTVMSGSMEPAIHTGDVIVDRKIPAANAKVGDVITFRDPENRQRLKTHRVYGMRIMDGTVHFTTKGDANNNVEKWQVPATGEVGRVGYRLWRLGYVTHWITSRFGRLALVVLPALLLGMFELKRIWLPRGELA
jgi:signal peptidase I